METKSDNIEATNSTNKNNSINLVKVSTYKLIFTLGQTIAFICFLFYGLVYVINSFNTIKSDIESNRNELVEIKENHEKIKFLDENDQLKIMLTLNLVLHEADCSLVREVEKVVEKHLIKCQDN